MTTLSEAQEERAKHEREELRKFCTENDVEATVSRMLAKLFKAMPTDPRQWLLDTLEQELTEDADQPSEAELRKLFASARRINSEIMPRETVDLIIEETLKLLHCDTVSLFVLDKKSAMLRLFASNLENPVMVSPGQGIAGSVFSSGEMLNISDCYADQRFDSSFDNKTGYFTKTLLVAPILDFEGAIVGVLQAINKLPPGVDRLSLEERAAGTLASPFSRHDEKVLQHLTQHCGIALRNAEVYREAINSSERSTGLLNTIQSLSQDLGIQSLLLTITMHANKIVSSQRSTVFLVDEASQQLWSVSTDTGQEIRIPKKAGIAGQCCIEGITIEIPDAYADERFNREVDKQTGFRTHSILAIPIFQDAKPGEGRQRVIGVIQMINKQSYDGQLEAFEAADIEIMELFAKFVSPQLQGSSLVVSRKALGESMDAGPLTEGELALGKTSSTLLDREHSERARKRASLSVLEKQVEVEEEEEDDEADT